MINLSLLKNFSFIKKFSQGTIITKSHANTEMFIIIKGEVGLILNYHKPKQELISTQGAGGFFNESAFFTGNPTPVTSVALTDVITLAINRNNAVYFIREEPEFTIDLMRELYARYENIQSDYEKLTGHPWREPVAVPEMPLIKPVEKEEKAEVPVQVAPAPKSEPDASKTLVSTLFPAEHGNYTLPLNPAGSPYLMEKGYTCPLCGKSFKALRVRTSKLVVDKTESDMRCRYKEIEPLYYDVVTCPHCLYSALHDMFGKPDKGKAELLEELRAFTPDQYLEFGTSLNTEAVFAGYYLALFCAPKCFVAHPLATAKLCLILYRMYQDCGDEKMVQISAKRTLEAYLNVYEKADIGPSQEQQLYLIIGELYLKLQDIKNAESFFFKAKGVRAGTPLLKDHAQDRIFDIREMGK